MIDRWLAAVANQATWLVPIVGSLAVIAAVLTARRGWPEPAAAPGPPIESRAPAAELSATIAVPATPNSPALPAPSTATPAVTSTPPPRRPPTATPDPGAWRGRALTGAIVRERPTTDALPAGLLLTGETAEIDEVVTGEEIEPGQATWYRVRSGVMAGYVYGTLFEPDPRPADR